MRLRLLRKRGTRNIDSFGGGVHVEVAYVVAFLHYYKEKNDKGW